LVIVTVAAFAVTTVRVMLVQAFVVPTSAMQPALQMGDRVLVSRLDYRLGEVRRGDVIVFNGAGVVDPPTAPPRSPLAGAGRAIAEALGAPVGENDYVKRVIGLPGERVVCCNSDGALTVDGRPLAEPYLHGPGPASGLRFDIRVPAGRLWVMGDDRAESVDSGARVADPGGGTVPLNHVVGRVMTVWWPWARATGVGRYDHLPAPSRLEVAP
jgi:signal peptidase I